MRDYNETLEWYENHTTAEQIGFNPDGMCLKVCRTARRIGSVYPSAKVAEDATPERYRVYKVADLRRGMVGYFDDPKDSNKFGHIATMVGRVKGFDKDKLSDTLWVTNSVQKGRLTVVRGDYFERYWGDKFQFGATWLNGVQLDVFQKANRLQRFKRGGSDYNVRLLDNAITMERRVDLKKTVQVIDELVAGLPKDKRRKRIALFRSYYQQHRVLRMSLLDAAVKQSQDAGRDDFHTRNIRNALRQAIKALPDR